MHMTAMTTASTVAPVPTPTPLRLRSLPLPLPLLLLLLLLRQLFELRRRHRCQGLFSHCAGCELLSPPSFRKLSEVAAGLRRDERSTERTERRTIVVSRASCTKIPCSHANLKPMPPVSQPCTSYVAIDQITHESRHRPHPKPSAPRLSALACQTPTPLKP